VICVLGGVSEHWPCLLHLSPLVLLGDLCVCALGCPSSRGCVGGVARLQIAFLTFTYLLIFNSSSPETGLPTPW